MELVYTCKGCNKDRVLDSVAKTREEFLDEADGEDFKVYCPFCEVTHNIKVNHVTAMKTTFEKFAPFIYWWIAVVVLLAMIPLSMSILAFIIFFGSILIPIYIYYRIESSVKTFNSILAFDKNK